MAEQIVAAFNNETPLKISHMSWPEFITLMFEIGILRMQAGRDNDDQ